MRPKPNIYSIQRSGKLTAPWQPIGAFDDGTKTFIKFREPLTYTLAPGAYGVTPQGQTALVQTHMYTKPGQPEQDAWLVIQGLWPALELKDNAGLSVRIVRDPLGQEESRAH